MRGSSLCLPLACLLLGCIASCAGPRKDAQRAELVVACDFDHPPFASLNSQGVPEGRDVEMMRQLAGRLERVLIWKRLPFSQLLDEVELLRVESACATLGITPERAARVDFTRPYFATEIVALVAAGGPASLEQLAGAQVAAAPGTTSERAALEYLEGARLIGLADGAGARAVLVGEIDALVLDREPARRLLRSHPGLEMLSEPLVRERYGIAVARGLDRGELLAALNAELEAMERSGELEELNETWLALPPPASSSAAD